MPSMHWRHKFLIITALGLVIFPQTAAIADSKTESFLSDSQLSSEQKRAFAENFVARISSGFKKADQILYNGASNEENNIGQLAEGEILFLQVRIDKTLMLPSPVTSQIHKSELLISLKDFVTALEFPIDFDSESGNASGWYIRQNKTFQYDSNTKSVTTDHGTFKLSAHSFLQDGDLFVTGPDLAAWFDLGIETRTSSLDLLLTSKIPLPVQERLERRKREIRDNRTAPPSQPTIAENRRIVDFPFVDVSTRSSFERYGDDRDSRNLHQATVRTSGDLAYGTLTTQSQFNKEDNLTSLRANYKRESTEPELLGPLKARRYEVGDLNTVRLPLGNVSQEQGLRITNTHPLRSFLRPSTTINGSTFPEWDIELYRDSQLVAFQIADDNGYYQFDNVELFSTDNNFKVIMYGPQGEIREENVYIPVDPQKLSETGSIYDISLTRQDTQTYNKRQFDNEDTGTPHFRALYERPIGDESALTLGLESRQQDNEQRSVAQAGLSSVIADTLINLSGAVDNNSEMAAEIVARRKIGDHQIRNEINLATDHFEEEGQDYVREVLREDFSLNGPLPFLFGNKPRYTTGFNYSLSSEDDKNMNWRAGVSTNWKRLSMSQNFIYGSYDPSSGNSFDSLNSLTTLSGTLNGFRLRLLTDYEMKPDNELSRVSLSAQRRINSKIDAGVDLQKRIDTKLTEGTAYMNWDSGLAKISPSLTYNSDNDLIATINTRFGIARDPLSGSVRMFDTPITSNGGFSAFVYLDKNGDQVFNEGEEPLSDVTIIAPQNGGKVQTDEDGYAFFKRMSNLRITDIVVERSSLQDPSWIPAHEGLSVIPREGYVASAEFPIHISGEIDGTIYAVSMDGSKRPLRSVRLSLYNLENGKAINAVSESDGYYLISQIPPGKYYFNIEKLPDKNLRQPLPRIIEIGYEGTVIYGHDITVQDGIKNIPVRITSAPGEFDGLQDNQDQGIYINLGYYNSSVMMGIKWFQIRKAFPAFFNNAVLRKQPSQSVAYLDSGKHSLDVWIEKLTPERAYAICDQVTRRLNIDCGLKYNIAQKQEMALLKN